MTEFASDRAMSLNLDSWLTGDTGMEGANFDDLLHVNEASFIDACVKELEGQVPSYEGTPPTSPVDMGQMTSAPSSLPGPFSSSNESSLVFPSRSPGLPQPAVPLSSVHQTTSTLPQTLSQTVSSSIPSTFTPSMPASLAQTVSGGIPTTLPPGMSLPSGTSSSLHQPIVLAPAVTTGLPDVDESNSVGGDSGVDCVKLEDGESNRKRRKRRSKTPQQQMLNRLAQQRYRERRKAKYSELESTVEGLVDQLERLQAVEKTNQDLKEQNEQLNKQLREHQEELHSLRQQLQRHTEAAAAAAVPNGVIPAHHTPGPDPSNEQPTTDYEALRSKLGSFLETMREVLARHSLDIKLEGPLLKELPQGVIAELAAAVEKMSSNASGVGQGVSSEMQRVNRVVYPCARATWNASLGKEQEDISFPFSLQSSMGGVKVHG